MAQNNMFKFVLVESGQAKYNELVETSSIDRNSLYAVPETSRIYFDGNLIADKNVIVSEDMPSTATGKEGVVYVVTGDANRGVYTFVPATESESASYNTIVPSNIITTDGVQTLTNKTIDADKNTISNIEVDNFKASAIATVIADIAGATDDKLATEKAVRTELDTKVDKVEGKSLVDDDEIAKLATVEENANAYVHPGLAASVEAGTAYNKVTFDAYGHVASATAETTAAGLGITDVYTQTEIDTKLGDLVRGLDWKETVNTYDDIATTYPNPEEGWTVSVKDTDAVYRYDSDSATWINVFNAETNIVEASVDGQGGHAGLMTATMAEKLGGIAAGAEVNQNAINTIVTDDGSIVASSKTDSVTIKGGTDVSVKVVTEDDGAKSIEVSSTYAHPVIAPGVTAGTAYNKVTFDATGHVASATAETDLQGLGVTGTTKDIVSLEDYAIATEKAVISTDDTLNVAIGKLEYRMNTQAEELKDSFDAKLDDTQLKTTLDSESTVEDIASAKTVYDALTVVRI